MDEQKLTIVWGDMPDSGGDPRRYLVTHKFFYLFINIDLEMLTIWIIVDIQYNVGGFNK